MFDSFLNELLYITQKLGKSGEWRSATIIQSFEIFPSRY